MAKKGESEWNDLRVQLTSLYFDQRAISIQEYADKLVSIEEGIHDLDGGGGFWDHVFGFVMDILETSAYQVVGPINNFTGHTYKIKWKTGLGHIVGGLGVMGNQSVHILGKTIADAFTAGYATKLVNEIRSDENKEKPGQYNEMKNNNLTGTVFESAEKISKVGAQVIGQVFGKIYGAAGIPPDPQKNPQQPAIVEDDSQAGSGGMDMSLFVLAGVALLVLIGARK
jgi:hypothetical protein